MLIFFFLKGDDFHFSTVVTFSYFSTFSALIDEICNLFEEKRAQVSDDVENAEEQRKKLLLPIIIRVTSVMKQLFEIHMEEFRRNSADYKKLIEFISTELRRYMEKSAITLKEYMIKKMSLYNFHLLLFLAPKYICFFHEKLAQVQPSVASDLQFDTKPPKPKMSRSLGSNAASLNVHAIHSLELARQLALIHHQQYRAIHVEEILHMRWTKNDKQEKAPNVIASIHHFCE